MSSIPQSESNEIPIINTGKQIPTGIENLSTADLAIDTTPKKPGTCYRDGAYLVVAGVGELDLLLDRCIKTNEPTSVRKKFWAKFPKAVKPGSVIGLALMASGKRLGVTVNYPINEKWIWRRRAMTIVAIATAIIGALLFSAASQNAFWESWNQFGSYAGTGLSCTGLVLLFAISKNPPLSPFKEQGGYTWFLGAGKALLESLPPRPGTRG